MMKWIKNHLTLVILTLIAISIKIFSLYPSAVEKYYSNGIYLYSSRLQRWIFGWIPFSIGDIIYALFIFFLLFGLIQFIRKRKLPNIYTSIQTLLAIYIAFNFLWGLNYNRENIYNRYDLEPISLDSTKINLFASTMVERLKELGDVSPLLYPSNKDELNRAGTEMQKHPHYPTKSIKASLFGVLGNYLGYSGYYNPLTGEAQVNTCIPPFTIPFTSLHEIGHQLGAAKESEANFVGFLAAIKSKDPVLQYSAYLDGYLYAQAYLRRISPTQVEYYKNQVPDYVLRDLQYLEQFWKKYRNPVDRFINILYGEYLKVNDQPEGMLSYSGLVMWLIAYGEKYGYDFM